MTAKSSVSALQEFCAKNSIGSPTYDYIDSDDGSFICKAVVLGMEAFGYGRSKRDAKHQSAANVIKKVRITYPDIDEIPQMPNEEIPTTDIIVVLRDYCVQNQHPLPTIEIVQQAGTPDAPEFTAVCSLASIKRYGVSEKKKDARQKAALEMLHVIIDDNNKLEHHMQVATLQAKADDVEAERYRKFKTYRELTESTTGDVAGVLLCNRHNYFSDFYPELKTAARTVLDTFYETEEEQATEVLRALKIRPKIKKLPAVNSSEPILFIELNCAFDAVFAGPESRVFSDIIEYFRDMLH